LDGQLKTRKEKNDDPKVFYNHKLHNIQEAQKHYQEIYKSKISYIGQSYKSLQTKKQTYDAIKYNHKLSKLNSQKKSAQLKLQKQEKKIRLQLSKLKTTFAT
jgi:hypothetical protein